MQALHFEDAQLLLPGAATPNICSVEGGVIYVYDDRWC